MKLIFTPQPTCEEEITSELMLSRITNANTVKILKIQGMDGDQTVVFTSGGPLPLRIYMTILLEIIAADTTPMKVHSPKIANEIRYFWQLVGFDRYTDDALIDLSKKAERHFAMYISANDCNDTKFILGLVMEVFGNYKHHENPLHKDFKPLVEDLVARIEDASRAY